MACSMSSPMNKIITPDERDAIERGRREASILHEKIEIPGKPRPRVRRRWGGRLFAFGGLLLLGGGVSVGAWGHYSQDQQVMATAEQERDFVPSLRVATVEASPAVNSVTLPATTAAFAAASIYARATGYIDKRN